MELQISHCVCIKIQKKDFLWEKKEGHWSFNIETGNFGAGTTILCLQNLMRKFMIDLSERNAGAFLMHFLVYGF